jgi:flagellar motor protein MotB
MGLDIGCSYRFLEHSEFGNHTVGLSTVNLLAPSMSSSPAPQFGHEGAYSRDLRLSWFATLWDNQLESGLEMDIKDFWANADEFQDMNDASRAAKELEWGIAWRLGALIKRFFKVYLQLGFDENIVEYWGLAGGVKIPLAHKGKNISTLYQYNLKTEGTLASAHTVYLFVNFENPFQERWGKEGRDSVAEDRSDQKEESLNDLKQIIGLEIMEGDEYVRITAEEVALHFKSGSSELPRKCIQVIKKIARLLRAYPDNPVSIEGHTDSDPITGRLKRKYPDNQTLSKARAEKVKEYFVIQEQLPEKLFTTRGYGDSKPIASNDTKEGKYKNRRVVITIQKK